jgi:capsular polysaccharide biosynthesis protein
VVVGAHGAGLANLLFCTPGTKVLELFAPRCVNLCYWVISNHAGLNYHYLLGEGPWPGSVDPITGAGIGGQDDIEVNEVKLWMLVEKLLAA